MSKSTKRLPRFVNYREHAQDFACASLSAMGWSTKAISRHTNLSENQVTYRIGKMERKRVGGYTLRSLYRTGQGSIARFAVQQISTGPVKDTVENMLRLRGLYNGQVK